MRMLRAVSLGIVAVLASGRPLRADPPIESTQGKDSHTFEIQLRRAIQIPSTNTHPVEFSIGEVRLHVPRNYITDMSDWQGGPQTFVSLRVNLPELSPLTAENKQCFADEPLARPPGCHPTVLELRKPADQQAEASDAQPWAPPGYASVPSGLDGLKRYVKSEKSGLDFFGISEYYVADSGGRRLLLACLSPELREPQSCMARSDLIVSGISIHYNIIPLYDVPLLAKADAAVPSMIQNFITH